MFYIVPLSRLFSFFVLELTTGWQHRPHEPQLSGFLEEVFSTTFESFCVFYDGLYYGRYVVSKE